MLIERSLQEVSAWTGRSLWVVSLCADLGGGSLWEEEGKCDFWGRSLWEFCGRLRGLCAVSVGSLWRSFVRCLPV
jgi:hypothetical protein